ncbi:hypothetical protein Tco_0707186, partial [Tanacetum coccineum]
VVEGSGGSKWCQRDGIEVGDDEVVMSSGVGMDRWCGEMVVRVAGGWWVGRILVRAAPEKDGGEGAFDIPKKYPNLEPSLDHLHKIFTPPFIILKQDSIFHARILLEQPEVFNHVFQLFQNSCQRAITELVHLSLPHHLLLIIPISVDYGPWLGNNGVIFFEEKISSILTWFCKVELRLIALNAELELFHTFSDDDVPNP